MEIISTQESDLTSIARCHRAAFPESLSSKLGLGYCKKMLSLYIEDDRGVIFHLSDGRNIVGYCGGLRNRVAGQHGSATSMTQHSFRSLVINLIIRPWLVLHPQIRANIPLIMKNIKLRFSRRAGEKVVPPMSRIKEFVPSMGLVVIGVSPVHQGKGYGSLLLKEFELRARQECFPRIHLSVHKDNHQAITAYKRNGWVVAKDGPSDLHMFKNLE